MITLKRLMSDAVSAMAELHAAAFPPAEAWPASAFADLFMKQTTKAEGVERDGRLVAMIVVQFVAGEAEILTLAAAPDERRRGLAGQMLAQLEQELRPLGLNKWLLDVAADNTAALAFYAKHGFRVDGHRRNYYKRTSGVRIDAVLMSKPVGGQIPN